jgi:hypothetical protein
MFGVPFDPYWTNGNPYRWETRPYKPKGATNAVDDACVPTNSNIETLVEADLHSMTFGSLDFRQCGLGQAIAYLSDEFAKFDRRVWDSDIWYVKEVPPAAGTGSDTNRLIWSDSAGSFEPDTGDPIVTCNYFNKSLHYVLNSLPVVWYIKGSKVIVQPRRLKPWRPLPEELDPGSPVR